MFANGFVIFGHWTRKPGLDERAVLVVFKSKANWNASKCLQWLSIAGNRTQLGAKLVQRSLGNLELEGELECFKMLKMA